MIGLALGVLVMIVVLSVMNGFDHEMRTRVLGMVPHATIESPQPIGDWQALGQRLMAHPQVAACAAIGVADEKSGEVVKLFVVPSDAALTVEALQAYCRENFTGYKVPRHYVFRDSLPMTPVGKILRRELRDLV